MKQIFFRKNGFTLIELLVVMFITAAITTISLADYRTAEKKKRVSLAADGITSVLTLAQNYAVTGKSTNDSVASCRVPQYYYVTISNSSIYYLSALNNCGGVNIIEAFTLPASTRIKTAGLTIDGANAATTLNIAFYPPFGKIKAYKDSGSYAVFSNSSITVEAADGSSSKTVSVDGIVGRIGQ